MRKEQNLSQSDIADQLQISQTAYHKIEKGDTSLVSDRVSQIASILHSTEEELIFGREFSPSNETFAALEEKDRRIAELEEIIRDKNRIIQLLSEKIDIARQ